MGKKRGIFLVAIFTLLFTFLYGNKNSAEAQTYHTKSEAVGWIREKANTGWWQDVDGSYGCQCVDLIYAYYNYLVGYSMGGNAKDYLTDSKLPAGWYRDNTPSEGAIIVWGGNVNTGQWTTSAYGHVGLVYAVDGSWVYTVETNTGGTGGQGSAAAARYCQRYRATNASYIHPDFTDTKIFSNVELVSGGAGKIEVVGWAFNNANPTEPMTIHVYIGGDSHASGGEGHQVTCDKERKDVGAVYSGVGDYHGFGERITTAKRGLQKVYIFGINGNTNPCIWAGTVNIEEAVECTVHKFTKYVSNNDGTHRLVCSECDISDNDHLRDKCVSNSSSENEDQRCKHCDYLIMKALPTNEVIEYPYYYFRCANCGHKSPWWGSGTCYTDRGGCGGRIELSSGVVFWSESPWSKATDYGNGKMYNAEVDAFIYNDSAEPRIKEVTVKYMSGDTEIDSVQVKMNQIIPSHADAVAPAGFSFAGWYKEKTYVNKVSFGTTRAYEDMIIYAKFVEDVCEHTSLKKSNKFLKSKATCEKAAFYYYECDSCHEKMTKTYSYGDPLGHDEVTTTKTATVDSDGYIVTTCDRCKKELSRETINRAYVSIGSESVYTGKAISKPVSVTDKNGKAISTSNYSVSYKNNIKVGTATATVNFKNNYSGNKSLTFKIVPKAATVTKVVAGTKAITVKWKVPSTSLTGYQIQYDTASDFKKVPQLLTIKPKTTTAKKISKLKTGKTYYVRLRVYKTVGGKKYYSSWSKTFKAKVKK